MEPVCMFVYLFVYLCVCTEAKDLAKSQENVGLNQSYPDINLKLALLHASFFFPVLSTQSNMI